MLDKYIGTVVFTYTGLDESRSAEQSDLYVSKQTLEFIEVI